MNKRPASEDAPFVPPSPIKYLPIPPILDDLNVPYVYKYRDDHSSQPRLKVRKTGSGGARVARTPRQSRTDSNVIPPNPSAPAPPPPVPILALLVDRFTPSSPIALRPHPLPRGNSPLLAQGFDDNDTFWQDHGNDEGFRMEADEFEEDLLGLSSAGEEEEDISGSEEEEDISEDEVEDDGAQDADDQEYYQALLEDAGLACTRLNEEIWCFEDCARDGPLYGRFVHLYTFPATLNRTESLACDCRTGQTTKDCRHSLLFRTYRDWFNLLEPITSSENPQVIEIAQGLHGHASWLSVLKSPANAIDGKRVIVAWSGEDLFRCSSCKRSSLEHPPACLHRQRARDYLVNALGRAVGVQAVNAEQFPPRQIDELDILQRDPVQKRGRATTHPVSYLPIPPPHALRLSSDTIPHNYTAPSDLPTLFQLEQTSRCPCGIDVQQLGNPQRKIIACRIYTLDRMLLGEIEVAQCSCKVQGSSHRIGPDLGMFGVYNWNNEILIHHEVFNSYSSQFLTASTPINAFQTRMQDRYKETHSKSTFLCNTTFNNILYAYIAAQFPTETLQCSLCGPEPEHLIVDGVSIAFSATNRTSTLRPPTVPSENLVCEDVRPISGLHPFIISHAMRRDVSAAIKRTRSALRREEGGTAGTDTLTEEVSLTEEFSWVHLRRASTLLGTVPSSITEATPSLPLFSNLLLYLTTLPQDRSHYTELYLHFEFLLQLSAHESILQLCRPHLTTALLESLRRVRAEDSRALRTIVAGSPSIGKLLKFYKGKNLDLPHPLIGVLMNLAHRIDFLYEKMSRGHEAPVIIENGEVDLEEWKKTGACYGKEVRGRPYYSNFKEVGSSGAIGKRWGHGSTLEGSQKGKGTGKEKGKGKKKADSEENAEIACQKFYNTYSGPKQTGGIMVIWCPHSVSLGFHCIPTGEGRNDAFSAILRYRVKAPKTVVYDFACALGPYCLSREPQFYKETLFVIDQFHQQDHTKCTSSCFLTSYMDQDPDLCRLNSSAAECGNAGLARIRKSISYCRQYQATLLTRHFLILWNRRQQLSSENTAMQLSAEKKKKKKKKNSKK